MWLVTGETWTPCWNGTGLTGTVGDLVIKNESTMIVVRGRGDLPLKTNDGGETWHEMQGCSLLKDFGFGMLYVSRFAVLTQHVLPVHMVSTPSSGFLSRVHVCSSAVMPCDHLPPPPPGTRGRPRRWRWWAAAAP